MSGTKKIKGFLLSIVLCLCINPLFSYENLDTICEVIDVIFENKSEEALSKLMAENIKNPKYQQIENYVVKLIRRQIIEAQYDFALRATYIVLDSNIEANYDDDEAFVLYIAISNETYSY
ncbi:MAG: hypothetical protein IKX23_00415 [Treponema sp.]|nr:hypothetical protein [Treponema sp.]